MITVIWLGTWVAQSLTGWAEYSQERLEHHAEPVSWVAYLGKPDFWERTMQNWRSEFLAVGSIAVLSVYLRQRGSAQSSRWRAARRERHCRR